jgi:hypothetical protein
MAAIYQTAYAGYHKSINNSLGFSEAELFGEGLCIEVKY